MAILLESVADYMGDYLLDTDYFRPYAPIAVGSNSLLAPTLKFSNGLIG